MLGDKEIQIWALLNQLKVIIECGNIYNTKQVWVWENENKGNKENMEFEILATNKSSRFFSFGDISFARQCI